MQYNFQRMVAYDPAWPEPLRERIGRDAVQQGALINWLSVEPELGTPQRGGLPATVGRLEGDTWRISGRKLYSTGIPVLTWLAVVGRTEEPEPRFGLFIVHRDAPGISIEPTWDHLGMRATHSHDVILEDTPAPLENFVSMKPFGQRTDQGQMARMAWFSVLTGALYNAVAESARDWLVQHIHELKWPGVQNLEETVGEIDALLFTNRALLDSITAQIYGNVAFDPTEGTLVKFLVTRNAIGAAGNALKFAEAHGFARNSPLERHYRNLLCSRIHTPQNDVILTGAGRKAFAAL